MDVPPNRADTPAAAAAAAAAAAVSIHLFRFSFPIHLQKANLWVSFGQLENPSPKIRIRSILLLLLQR